MRGCLLSVYVSLPRSSCHMLPPTFLSSDTPSSLLYSLSQHPLLFLCPSLLLLPEEHKLWVSLFRAHVPTPPLPSGLLGQCYPGCEPRILTCNTRVLLQGSQKVHTGWGWAVPTRVRAPQMTAFSSPFLPMLLSLSVCLSCLHPVPSPLPSLSFFHRFHRVRGSQIMEPRLFVLQMRILPRGKVLSKLTQRVRKSWERTENLADGSFLKAEMRGSPRPPSFLSSTTLPWNVFHVPGGKTKARPARALLPWSLERV